MSDPLSETATRAFELDSTLIGRVLGIDLPEPVRVTRLNEYIPDPKTIERGEVVKTFGVKLRTRPWPLTDQAGHIGRQLAWGRDR